MPSKITFVASSFASALCAFGIGAMAFGTPATTADAPQKPQPTRTVTETPSAPEKPAQHTVKPAAPKTTTKPTAKPTTGSKGPFTDAEEDGKYLDDLGKYVLPDGIGDHVPDAILPFDPDQSHESSPPPFEGPLPGEGSGPSDYVPGDDDNAQEDENAQGDNNDQGDDYGDSMPGAGFPGAGFPGAGFPSAGGFAGVPDVMSPAQ